MIPDETLPVCFSFDFPDDSTGTDHVPGTFNQIETKVSRILQTY